MAFRPASKVQCLARAAEVLWKNSTFAGHVSHLRVSYDGTELCNARSVFPGQCMNGAFDTGPGV